MLTIELENVDGQIKVLLNKEDISDKIRNETVSQAASKVSTYQKVRKHLVKLTEGSWREVSSCC